MPLQLSPFTFVIIITAALLFVVYIMYFAPGLTKKVLAAKVGPYNLGEPQPILLSDEARPYYEGPDGTFSAFIYLNTFNRTGAHVTCGTERGQATCADGTFAPCACGKDTNPGDCSPCAHEGYKTIFNIANVAILEVLTAPDASRQGKAMCQLVLKTKGPIPTSGTNTTQPQIYIETLTLPPMDFQKWTLVTIAREGRRFDVYFNDRIVLSKKTMYMPIAEFVDTSFTGANSGSDGLGGQIAIINLYNYRLNSGEVAETYKTQADTRGRPYLPEGSAGVASTDMFGFLPSAAGTGFNLSMPKVNLCPQGGCLSAPVIQPASPVFEWTTDY